MYNIVTNSFPEPLRLSTGKEYNLNNLKETKVREQFLTLNKEIIHCQNKESSNVNLLEYFKLLLKIR